MRCMGVWREISGYLNRLFFSPLLIASMVLPTKTNIFPEIPPLPSPSQYSNAPPLICRPSQGGCSRIFCLIRHPPSRHPIMLPSPARASQPPVPRFALSTRANALHDRVNRITQADVLCLSAFVNDPRLPVRRRTRKIGEGAVHAWLHQLFEA